MKKIIIPTLIFVLVIAAGYFSFRFFSGRQPQSSAQTQSGLLSNSTLPADYPIEGTFPKGETIAIGTKDGIVEMKNFYNAAVDTEEGSVILKENDTYQIAYDRRNSSFLIYLKNPSSKDVRQNAETDFLNILGIGQPDACKLNVQVLVSPRQFGENQNLSFCLNKVQ